MRQSANFSRLAFCLVFFFILIAAALPRATAQSSPKTIAEWYDAAYMLDSRAGYVHTKIEELDNDGFLSLRSTIAFRLTVKRNGAPIQLAMDSGTHELADGRVLGTFMKQSVGGGKSLEIIGAVDGRQLTLTLDKTKVLKPAPWDPRVLGVIKQKTLFKDKAVKAGDAFTYQAFEPTLNLVANYRVVVRDFEEVELFAGKHKRRLLRVDVKADKIEGFQLPGSSAWLDETHLPLRSESEIPGLGRVVTYSASKSFALAANHAPPALDVGSSQLIRLTKRIPRPHETAAAVYLITVKDADDVTTLFAQDARQSVKKITANTLEVQIRAGDGAPTAKPGVEFTQHSYFINSADAKVQDLARRAVGGENDPWKKALKIEKWVHGHMTVRQDAALAPADQVARTLAGDCTEFAMLTAAMCRAEGIPSRTATGLVYAEVRGGPVFAFHMWTEVWNDGIWQPLDATLGRGGIGAAHLKISAQSWQDEQSMTPLLPIMRVLGRLSIDVVRIDPK